MRLRVVLVSVFVFVAVVCVVLATVSINTTNRSLSRRHEDQNAAAPKLQDTATLFRSEESVLSSRHSNARLRLLADYSRSAEISESVDTVAVAPALVHSIPATVRPPATPAPRRPTPPAQPPTPPTPKLSESPVLRLKNSEKHATANIVVNDYVANTLLATVFLTSSPDEIPFHYESVSHEYQLSGTVQFNGKTVNIPPVVCTEFATVVLSVLHQTGTAELRCDANHSQPNTVTISNESPDDAQLSVVDGTTGAVLSQVVLRSGSIVNLKDGNPKTVFVVYARAHGINWHPAGCNYRGTVTISGSAKSDSGVKVTCDDEHKAKPALKIINGSGECPVQTSIFPTEKQVNAGEATKPLDEFNVNCGDTAESFIGTTENSSRKISVRMADGTIPSIVCPAGSTVLIGGSGIHC